MLSSKIFSLLAFAAAAVAQGFPSGQFFIANAQSELVLEAENGGPRPGGFIILAERNASNHAQIWSYAQGRGFLMNEASHLVLEVPRTNGAIEYGTSLEEAEPRTEANDDLNQLWDYAAETQLLFTLADDTACVSGNETFGHAIVDFCSRDSDSQQWRLISF